MTTIATEISPSSLITTGQRKDIKQTLQSSLEAFTGAVRTARFRSGKPVGPRPDVGVVGPVFLAVPPGAEKVATREEAKKLSGYGGSEKVIAGHLEALNSLNIQTTYYGAGGSKPEGQVRALTDGPLWTKDAKIQKADTNELYKPFIDDLNKHDFVITHLDYRALNSLAPLIDVPFFNIEHAPIYQKRHEIYKANAEFPLVFISDAQRQSAPKEVNTVGILYHSVPRPKDMSVEGDEGCDVGSRPVRLGFQARLVAAKGAKEALDWNDAVNGQIVLAGPAQHPDYFKKHLKHRIETIGANIDKNSQAHWMKEITEQQKATFYGNVDVMISPTNVLESFNLIIPEAALWKKPIVGPMHAAVLD